MGRKRCLYLVTGMMLSQCAETAALAQWTQFGGPDRNFTCEPVELRTEWPEGGPPIVWSRPLGDGYSGIVVDGERLFTMYREGDSEVVIAVNRATGETIWEHRYTEPIDRERFAGRYGYGPRSTPLAVNGRVFVIGFNGRLSCLDARSGREHWNIKLLDRFSAAPTRWGYANSPIAYGDDVIVPVGGKDAALVSLEQKTGRVVWARHSFENSYSSPILISVAGREQMVCLMAKEIIGFDPQNGDLLWRHPHEGQWLNNIPNPLWGEDGLLFVTSEGDAGSRTLQLTGDKSRTRVRELWASKKFRVVHRNVIRIGELVLGSSGDFGSTIFSAVNVRTGEMQWRRRDVGRAGILRVGNLIVLLEESGRLMLASPSPAGLEIHASAEILGEPAWTLPTLLGKRLYLRDQRKLMAIDLP